MAGSSLSFRLLHSHHLCRTRKPLCFIIRTNFRRRLFRRPFARTWTLAGMSPHPTPSPPLPPPHLNPLLHLPPGERPFWDEENPEFPVTRSESWHPHALCSDDVGLGPVLLGELFDDLQLLVHELPLRPESRRAAIKRGRSWTSSIRRR